MQEPTTNTHTSGNNVLDNETLEKLFSIQNKTLRQVTCYLWQNNINPQQSVELIDAIEFTFNDGDSIILSSDENQTSLKSINLNYEQQKEYLQKEFSGKINLYKIDASSTKMWQDVINHPLSGVKMTPHGKFYLADELIFKFKNDEMRSVRVHPTDGIILDYYEEI